MRKITHQTSMKKITIVLGALLLLAAEPGKRHATCNEECVNSYCHVGSRQFVCQNECFAKCRSQRSEHK